VAHVISAEKHPNADKLKVCMVEYRQRRAGASRVRRAECAQRHEERVRSPGTFIPGKNITLGVGTIRGVESRGMLVSEAELELSDDHAGIIELAEDAPVGKPFAELRGLNDP
jgi:phenylalanyl-tRNA synthetase beta chain